MNQLSDLQINLIRGDIRQNGVELTDLEDDLLDHVCCAIEYELASNSSFEEVYNNIKQTIFPEGYRKIQETTTHLLTQKYTTMKKTMNISAIAGSSLLLIGSVMKLLRLTGSNETLALGALTLIAVYLPILLIFSLKQTDIFIGKIRNFSGYIGANLMIIGIVFQVLHYNYGKEMLAAGFLIFLLVFIPLFFKSLGKDAMMKIQPATATVLLVVVVSSLFAFSIKRPSTSYINSLLDINTTIEQTYKLKQNRITSLRTEDSELAHASQNALTYIDNLKSYLVSAVDANNKDQNLNIYNIFISDEKLNDILVFNNNKHELNGLKLQSLIENYVSVLQKQNPEIQTNLLKTKDGQSWVASNFLRKPLYGSYTTLSNMQLEIVELEMESIATRK